MGEDSHLKRIYDVTHSVTQVLCGTENHRKLAIIGRYVGKSVGFFIFYITSFPIVKFYDVANPIS